MALAASLPAQDASSISPFPRGQAMSEAYTCFAEDADAIYYNPALTVYGARQVFFLNYTSWIEGTSLASLAFRTRLPRGVSLGFLSTLFVADGLETTATGTGSPFALNSDGIWVPLAGSGALFYQFNLAANASYLLPIGKLLFPVGANLKLGRYAYNGEGKFHAALDLGTLLLVHESFGLESRVPSAILRGFIPSRVAVTVKNLGLDAATQADLASDFLAPELVAALGFDLFSARLGASGASSYALATEFDFSTLQGFSMGMRHRFRLGDIRPDAHMGLQYNGDSLRLSVGFQAGWRIKQVEYSVSYALRHLAGLSLVHQLSLGATLDMDLFGPASRGAARARRVQQCLTEVQALCVEGQYRAAAFLLRQYLEKYPDSAELKELDRKLRELDPKRDTFY